MVLEKIQKENDIKKLTPENLFKRYETFLYNSPSNKCKTK